MVVSSQHNAPGAHGLGPWRQGRVQSTKERGRVLPRPNRSTPATIRLDADGRKGHGYAAPVDDPVRLTTVADEIEADMVCDLLRSAGVECGHRVTEARDSALHGLASDGPQEVLVHRGDLDAARAVLAEKYKT